MRIGITCNGSSASVLNDLALLLYYLFIENVKVGAESEETGEGLKKGGSHHSVTSEDYLAHQKAAEANGLAKPCEGVSVGKDEEGVGQQGNGDAEVARLELSISIGIEIDRGGLSELLISIALITKIANQEGS